LRGAALALDTALDCSVALPRTVFEAAVRAAGLLVRASAAPGKTQEWAHYRQRFTERYGPDGLVSLLEVIDPHTGLGPGPSGEPVEEPLLTRRDRHLLEVDQRPALNGAQEVRL